MERLIRLLEELAPKVEDYKKNQEKRMETGFNLFYLISDYYYRETFHSDIIAALLDPCEKHGKNNCYTNLFIEMINKKSKEELSKELINKDFYTSPKVIKEFPTDDGNMRGRVDIFIEGDIPDEKGKKHCIVIENKLNNAGDTEQQLPKYSRDLETRNFEIDAYVYMPLAPNKEPNKTDWGEKRNDIEMKLVIIPAFKPRKVNLIDDWLKPALDKSESDASFIIQQYIRVLNNLTIDIMDNKEIIEVLTNNENNIEITLAIFENEEAFYNKMIDLFIKRLGNKAEKKGLKYSHKGSKRIELFNDRWKYFIEEVSKASGYCRGIESYNINKTIDNKNNFFGGEASRCDSKYPIGWDYFSGNRRYWSLPSTIKEMCNGTFSDFILEEVKSAFERMDQLYK